MRRDPVFPLYELANIMDDYGKSLLSREGPLSVG